jgi:hypothetical protein
MSNDKKNKIIVSIGITAVSLTLLAVIISSFIERKAPDPNQLGPKRKVTYMASKQFARLDDQEKVKYMKKVGRSRKMYKQLSTEERKAVFKNTRKIMRKQMKEKLNKFFAMSEEEQNKRLDEILAKTSKWRKNRRTRNNSNNQNASNNKKPKRNYNAHKQRFMENTDSTTRAQVAEFIKRLRQRRQQQQRR